MRERQKVVSLASMKEHSLLQFYISREWLNKFNTFAEPGPITNQTFLCSHGGEALLGTWGWQLSALPLLRRESCSCVQGCSGREGTRSPWSCRPGGAALETTLCSLHLALQTKLEQAAKAAAA